MSNPSENISGGSPRVKPRNSIRHSLGLASKAFADVINKDNRDSDKTGKKSKDMASRRLSGIALKPAAPRPSLGDGKPSLPSTKRVATPDKTITRRRVSGPAQRPSAEDPPAKSPDALPLTRSATLRPRTAPGSSLPKYRPKSSFIEGAKAPSPRAGTRRPHSNSDDDDKEDRKPPAPCSPAEKKSRPISPLPQRAALKSNLSSLVNSTPPSTPSKGKAATPSSTKSSPSRPAKFAKTGSSASVSSSIPRPPSSSSNRSVNQSTPKTPGLKNASNLRNSVHSNSTRSTPSPSRTSSNASLSDSPLAHRMSKNAKQSPRLHPTQVGNMSHISEADSEDSEAEDVRLLLAPVAALGAPTPAMPRIQHRNRGKVLPQTPSKSNLLPTRQNLSYLSPLPPTADSASSTLRPSLLDSTGKQARGSILSWEQLASEAAKTLGEDELEGMLSDIPAPFRSGAASPSPSSSGLEIPESPCLSALNSPEGYGSISQVLLPEVTPSPAVYATSQRYNMSELTSGDSATVTMLRLQLASAENMAKERLFQLQTMERELHKLKEARAREAQELAQQISVMEERLHENLATGGRDMEERSSYTVDLEKQVKQLEVLRDRAVDEAVARSEENMRAKHEVALQRHRAVCELSCSACATAQEWISVQEMAEMELQVVQGDRQVLSILLAQLDQILVGL